MQQQLYTTWWKGMVKGILLSIFMKMK